MGDGNNSLFTLETNGTLRTFDYESNASSYAIRVQVKDEHNATSEATSRSSEREHSEHPTQWTEFDNREPTQWTDPDAGAVLTYRRTETNGTLRSGHFRLRIELYAIRVQVKVQRQLYDPFAGDRGLSSTGTLSLYENQPWGIQCDRSGCRSGTDLSLGEWSRGREFLFETNGTLRSSVTFDYESNASSYAIRVQVKDEHNATPEGNFTVLLLDVNESTPNNPPSGLSSTGTLSVYENQPVGTLVGEFNATDPDAGAVLTYHLVSGVGNGNNSSLLWTRTARSGAQSLSITNRNASSYAIRVQVKDEHNATLEGNFTVLLLDAYEGPSSDFRGKNISSHDFSGQDLSTALFDHTTIFSSFFNGQRWEQTFLVRTQNLPD